MDRDVSGYIERRARLTGRFRIDVDDDLVAFA